MADAGSDADSNATGDDVGAPASTCSADSTSCQCGATSWVDTQAYCGDNAKLQATYTGTCPDGPATVEILHPVSGAVVDTVNANLVGGQVAAVWIAKAQTSNWRTDQIRFRVTAAGQTCVSTNAFTFRQRPTTAFVRGDRDRGTPSGFMDVYETVDQALEASRVHYSLKIKLTAPASAATPDGGTPAIPWDAAKQATEKSRIETIWNNGFASKRFHRTACLRGRSCNCGFDCCNAGFHLDVNFVTSGEHFAVEIQTVTTPGHSGTGKTGSTWSDPPLAVTTSYPHEVGHMLGQFDEYTGGACDPAGVQPCPAPAANLMMTAGTTDLFNRHYRWMLEFLNANSAGDVYETLPPP